MVIPPVYSGSVGGDVIPAALLTYAGFFCTELREQVEGWGSVFVGIPSYVLFPLGTQ